MTRAIGAILAAAFLALAVLAGAGRPAISAAFGDKPGDFDYYALVLSWSPTYCLDQGSDGGAERQCSAKRPYAFVLHGLWPQYEKGWPESCDIGRKPWVPKELMRSMLDIMPSERLIIHEYKKHGTCSGLDPEGYFAMARRLFGKVVIPQAYRAPGSEVRASVGQIVGEFLKANPKLRRDMIAVDCAKGGRLQEIHVCFSREGEFRACGRNEAQDRLCRAGTVSLPPVRGGGAGNGI